MHVFSKLLPILQFLTLPVVLAAEALLPPDGFVHPGPNKEIYLGTWIDLNKNGQLDIYEDSRQELDARIENLLEQMTLEEKTNQLATYYGFPRVARDELPTERWEDEIWIHGIGNIDEHINGNTGERQTLPDPEHDLPWSLHARAINEVQRWFIEKTRLGIPVDFTNEGIRGLLHSHATSFPSQVGVASTWNPQLVREVGRITGREARALGYTNVYSPIMDLPRDPRWGRVVECYSEDPFLTSVLGVEQIRGIQEQGVVSTLKHFAVYSIPKGGRDGPARTDPHASWRDVQTIYLTPFREGVMKGGALGIMSSYNDYSGIPVQASRRFLIDILRGEYGFRGYVVSDSGAVEYIHEKHRTAPSPADAIRQAVEAGLNIRTNFTKPQDYILPLRELVRSGRLSESVIDDRVRDVLRVKFHLGLFDRPYVDPDRAEAVVRAPGHLDVARQVARESIVLLKNDHKQLPLNPKNLRRLLVAGPLADDPMAWWSRYGPQRVDFVTPLEGIREFLGGGAEVRHVKGVDAADADWPMSDILKKPPSAAVRAGIDQAVRAAEDVDVIVAVLGETDHLCRESVSRVSLQLPGYQQELLEALHATGKPLVLVLSNGRPLSINWAQRHVDGIIQIGFQGEFGGAALAETLFGGYNPAGRLPVTYPRSVGQIPFNFPARPGSQAADNGQVEGPLYAFGHGLSYTTFHYDDLQFSSDRIAIGEAVSVSCRITNTGDRAGDEVVQLYLRDDFTSVVHFEQVLRGFQRIHLAPGGSRTVTFTLTAEDLQLLNADLDWVVEPGRFTVMLGASSTDIRLHGSFLVTDASGHAPEEAAVVDDPIASAGDRR